MDSYRYGCEAIQGIFPQMMIRRVDLVMFATAWDIENKEKIFFPQAPDTLPQLSSKDLQALIFYAWNLKEDQIVPGAKILSIIDAFEAVTLKHSHRGEGRSLLRAVAEINASDKQFPAEWIDHFNQVIRGMVEA